MDKEYLQEILNYTLSIAGTTFLMLVVKNLVQVLYVNHWKFKNLRIQAGLDFLHQMRSPIFGLILVLTSFALVNTLLVGAQNIPMEPSESNPQTLKDAFLGFDFTGFFATTFLIISGTLYIFSGFGSWVKWPARAFLLVGIFYVFIQMFRAAILMG